MVQWLDLDAELFDLTLLLDIPTALRFTIIVASTTFFRSSNSHIEVCNLVSILAGSWDLDRSSPIIVEVAEAVGQLLELDLFKRALIKGHIEVGRQDTTLIGP